MTDQHEREMTLEEWVGQLPTGHRARNDFAALQARVEEVKWERDVCEVCWTCSWDPCPDTTPSAVRDKRGGWKVCGMCAAQARIRDLEKGLESFRNYVEHQVGCPAAFMPRKAGCTCGLTAVLAGQEK